MNHLQEWGASCVDEQLIRLNVTALEGPHPYEYLLYSDQVPRRNDGRVRDGILRRYQHIEQGGWWCSGVNLLTGGYDPWGCFKPMEPRYSFSDNKLIKYEHPPNAPMGLFALRLPQHLWQQIASRCQLEVLPADIDPNQPDLGFWQWLMDHPTVPLCITEGAKKAGALLTAGYAAIALPGVNGGYRVPRDEDGNRIGKCQLIPQLLKLAASHREIYLVFDQDTKPSTVKAVNAAIRQTGYLLTQQGCSVKVITWNPEWGKGVDDFIANQGSGGFDAAYQSALPLETWKAKSLTRLTHKPDVQVCSRYLEPLPIPATARLVGIKSPKGTGKTQFLETIVAEALSRNQWVLVIGHRVQLVEALCQRFGLHYISEIRHDLSSAISGYGLCIDSLHPNSQAQFNAMNWSDGIVIIDEVEQVLWHGLNSSTCHQNRVAILKSLKTLMQNVLSSQGQVFVADADLSDISLNYLMALAGLPLQPFIIENEWKPTAAESWQVYHYEDSTPQRLVEDLERHIQDGGKPFVCLSAQKLTSQWGTRALEAYLKQRFPDRNILRIDSESLAEPTHPAYGCINRLNQVLSHYDIVLASPSIETGVSIEIRDHFTSVWGIAQGVQGENSVRQALGRVRENVPRYIWVAAYGFNQVGNGSLSIPALLTSEQRLTQLNIRFLQQSDFDAIDDLEVGFQAESLLCWAQMAVRFNAAMLHYRESVLAALIAEGHQIAAQNRDILGIELADVTADLDAMLSVKLASDDAASSQSTTLASEIAAIRQRNYQAECEAIAAAQDLSDGEYQVFKKQMIKTKAERHIQRKHELKLRYGVRVTADLVMKDDQGWYQKLQLHYFLTMGRSYLAERDAEVAAKLIEQGNGNIFLPDFNSSQLGAAIGTLELLGIPQIIADQNRELRNTDSDLQAMADLALGNRSAIKTSIGIGLAANSSPITIVRRFLDKLGYGLELMRSETIEKKRVRVYHPVQPKDGRMEIFHQWLAWDGMLLGTAENWRDSRSGSWVNPMKSVETDKGEYVQLCLKF